MQQNQQSQSNMIKNPKTTIPKTPSMNDRDFLNDMLSTEKYLTDSYCTALNEMSHEALYQDIRQIFNETQDCQRQLFNLMYKNGWYKLEAEDAQKVEQKHQQFYNYTTTQFPTHDHMLQ
ncbi:spore coat protein [Bacillus sp. PS06]|uniref:spore coat protein n=1 Tax=Bacillus sp. PS06 TaxID=2764176 RepID=UPI00177EDF6D|nr:spore coat protein [Bacillus sp. PS06]MBD8071481.1 spore coat protein [Bacillus sp. PS06]